MKVFKSLILSLKDKRTDFKRNRDENKLISLNYLQRKGLQMQKKIKIFQASVFYLVHLLLKLAREPLNAKDV